MNIANVRRLTVRDLVIPAVGGVKTDVLLHGVDLRYTEGISAANIRCTLEESLMGLENTHAPLQVFYGQVDARVVITVIGRLSDQSAHQLQPREERFNALLSQAEETSIIMRDNFHLDASGVCHLDRFLRRIRSRCKAMHIISSSTKMRSFLVETKIVEAGEIGGSAAI